MTDYSTDPDFVEGPSHDEATELMLAWKEIERLRAALLVAAERLEARGHLMGGREAREAGGHQQTPPDDRS